LEAALALIGGTGLMALLRMSKSATEPDFLEQIVTAILRGLGVSEAKITRLMSMKIEPLVLPGDSLLERGQARAARE
jgi:hypothetical protein